MSAIREFLISVCSLVYSGISMLYNVFLYLTEVNIFNGEENLLNDIIRRIYVLIGVIMLFFLAYSILRTIINPDTKDKNGTGKIVTNIVKAIIIIVIVPSVFEFAFDVQTAILEKNTIGKIILGTNNSNSIINANQVVKNGGKNMAVTIFEAFFYPHLPGMENESSETVEESMNNFTYHEFTYETIRNKVLATGDFSYYKEYSEIINEEERIEDGEGYIDFNWVFALIGGAFCIYILISYCLSLGLRIIKLAFYQLIAPIPAISDIVPGSKGMFSKWLKATLTTFAEVFIRIAVLFLMVYLIYLIQNLWNAEELNSANWLTVRLVKAMLVMGCVMFAKQAPKLISEITGIDSKNMSLGIKDQLAAGGGLMLGAAIGGGFTSGSRNFFGAIRNTEGSKRKKLGVALASGLAGAGSGFVRSGWQARGAKNYGDVSKAASAGILGATRKSSKRGDYKEKHNQGYRASYNASEKTTKLGKMADALQGGIIGAHIYDAGDSLLSFLGVTGNVEGAKKETKIASDLQKSTGKIKSVSSDFVQKHLQNMFYGLSDEEMAELQSLHNEVNSLIARNATEVEIENAKNKIKEFEKIHANQRLDVIKARSEAEIDFTALNSELEYLIKKRTDLDTSSPDYLTNLTNINNRIAEIEEEKANASVLRANAINEYNLALKKATDNFASTVQWMSDVEAEKRAINTAIEDIVEQLGTNAASNTVKGIKIGSKELGLTGLNDITLKGNEASWVKTIAKMAEESERINTNIISKEERKQAEKKKDK